MKKLILLGLSAVLLQANGAVAQEAVTSPVGFTTVNLIAGNATTPPTQYIGLGLAKSNLFQGKVVTSNGSDLTFAENSIADNAFDPVGGQVTHFLEVVDGAGAGAISDIISTDADAVSLSGDLSDAIVAGTTKVRIRKFWTVGEAFGPTNSAGFLGGATAGVSDVLSITRPGAPEISIDIFYNTTADRWETTAAADATNLPIPVDAGLHVLRRGTTEGSFKIVGDVKTGPTALWVDGGVAETVTLLQNPYPTGSVMLKDSGLFTGNATTGVVGGTSATNADLVTIQDPTTGVSNQFFFDTTSQRWKTGFTDASLIKIPENASIAITRRANRDAFHWFSPQPVLALGTEALPLNLVSAASRKTHGSAGTWDVNLPIGGGSGVESRTGGANGDYTVVFTFSGASSSNPITAANVSKTSGTGSVVGSPSFDGNTVTVTLTGVTNAQTLSLQIASVQAQNGEVFASASVPMRFLTGDHNSDGSVNVGDTLLARQSSSPGAVLLGNFRADANSDNTINVGDVLITRQRAGTSVAD